MGDLAGFEPWLAAVRALHAGAAMVLYGELLFASAIASDGAADARRRARVLALAWLLAALTSVAWLGLEAAEMSGLPWPEAWRGDTLRKVIDATLFGRAWFLHALLLLMLGGALVLGREERPRRPPMVDWLAAGFLVGIAWMGHANVETGAHGVLHHGADALHLLAAGAWLGGLAPFVAALPASPGAAPRTAIDPALARVVRRFGTLGAACVGVLVASGVVNAVYTLGSPTLLPSTPYGRVLSLKLALFALLLAIAAVNRWRLTPLLDARGPEALEGLARLRRHAWLEVAIGACIVLAAGVLGTSAPPMRAM